MLTISAIGGTIEPSELEGNGVVLGGDFPIPVRQTGGRDPLTRCMILGKPVQEPVILYRVERAGDDHGEDLAREAPFEGGESRGRHVGRSDATMDGAIHVPRAAEFLGRARQLTEKDARSVTPEPVPLQEAERAPKRVIKQDRSDTVVLGADEVGGHRRAQESVIGLVRALVITGAIPNRAAFGAGFERCARCGRRGATGAVHCAGSNAGRRGCGGRDVEAKDGRRRKVVLRGMNKGGMREPKDDGEGEVRRDGDPSNLLHQNLSGFPASGLQQTHVAAIKKAATDRGAAL
ncbi:hypothetical protein BDK51DRAFT_43977 [Blyttiomyces helicus]|uniref:Uncharacterized protein n=1 Tax=Blyttiomyces helicus TaxID=388810 RepID=A0A4P9WHY3_9FUNG|nr:hypothetical protein BDK51DRAFT_43977 [Blyttiomyces helicus]|eukprot:RKO91048.1 hypothetical protein BDK51DRAFT_43977 [Blyttiomyces helicus]